MGGATFDVLLSYGYGSLLCCTLSDIAWHRRFRRRICFRPHGRFSVLSNFTPLAKQSTMHLLGSGWGSFCGFLFACSCCCWLGGFLGSEKLHIHELFAGIRVEWIGSWRSDLELVRNWQRQIWGFKGWLEACE